MNGGGRKQWQTLIGDPNKLEWLAHDRAEVEDAPHPLQEVIEELVENILTDREKTVFYMRFGERAPHREIARRMGYKGHRVIQVIEQDIMRKIKEALES